MLKVEYIVNSIYDSITWFLSETNSGQVWLVDCGDTASLIEIIGARRIKGVLLTHAHFDHIYGLPELIRLFPECEIYTNSFGVETLANAKLNLSLYHGTPLTISGPNVIEKREGDTIALFEGIEAKILETPGHHPSCLTFLVDKFLFTGDAFIPGLKPVTNLPEGDKLQARESIERILMLGAYPIICPGHIIKHREI